MSVVDFRQCKANELLRSLSVDSLQAIICDPPYAASSEDGVVFPNGGYETINEAWDTLPDPEWLDLSYSCLAPGGNLLVCCSIHNMPYLMEHTKRVALAATGKDVWAYPKQEIVWEKTNPPGSIRKLLTFAHENVLWWVKPGAPYTFNRERIEGKALTDVWRIAPPGLREKLYGPDGKPLHPTQKPEELMRRLLVLFTNEGDDVCDPFAGTGTTLAVAARLGRVPIGCEPQENYYRTALARIEMEVSRCQLF